MSVFGSICVIVYCLIGACFHYGIQQDGRITEAVWLGVAKEWIEDELSMYEVGDEE